MKADTANTIFPVQSTNVPPPLAIRPSRARRQFAARLAQRKREQSGLEDTSDAHGGQAFSAIANPSGGLGGGAAGPGNAEALRDVEVAISEVSVGSSSSDSDDEDDVGDVEPADEGVRRQHQQGLRGGAEGAPVHEEAQQLGNVARRSSGEGPARFSGLFISEGREGESSGEDDEDDDEGIFASSNFHAFATNL
ncbi:hypothetical protein BDY21DRAFT_367768 [Lineolata rhizophorae]|uniref:Uncharacterized protein n=1 Tax=Lineolata rhizophorae TaxID=578093 RepID=A0A6A6NL91_9PEZI|nr:hypothetical protein BDY21DRAFT_367768 [Lineolata rhizophorae]